MVKPRIEEVRRVAQTGNYNIMPVSMEMLSDIKTPVEVMRILLNISQHCYMLESAENNENWGRYTFLGYSPKMDITCVNGEIKVDGLTIQTGHPGKYIRQILENYRSPVMEDLPTFTGGLVGYFSYDYLKYSEPSLHLDAEDTEGFKDVDLMLFDKVIAFDHFRQKIILIVNISLDNIEVEYNRAQIELKQMADLIKNGKPKQNLSGRLTSEIRTLFSKEEYCRMIEKAKRHIYEGDIFQIVLSNRLEADFEGSLFNTYRILRTLNPSPYMFYFSGSDMEVAGASPETLVKLENGILHTFPLAGTRPRGKTEEEDKRLERELLADPKELAEHNMLVDLGRNDIGKISKFGTVEVEKYHEIERFSHVMHIGSTVRGEIREDADSLNAVDAILPAGTLSGAPKIKACQLINDLENNKRGIYGGAIGYLDFSGNLDTCIAIRIAYKKNNKVFVRSGAGIVADSVPETEFQECLNKAAAVVRALEASQEEDL
ncbi:anthranilate synthase component I family protein [Bianquea renquensis]|uniref:Anthranilate synthase component 1 n=1 Tax=Bianquea renquensis TaxID=2763661 RepID=A0A926I2J9_9FIRM|nr:anthranilate synthase component I family protein [Bianquea renquensis]MBC8544578.1 anthranilate synthase component I family protein [Bianquea renquensis]